MYLLDTNIILELLLDQSRASEVEQLLRTTPGNQLNLTEFSLHSLGVILFRRQRADALLQIRDDLLRTAGVALIRLTPDDLDAVAEAARQFNLDFDDAYQYTAGRKYTLTIVSFDAHFDRTDRGRTTPAAILAAL